MINNQRVPYGTSLQIVGAYLEAQGATSFRLIEVPGGYQLQYRRASGEVVAPIEHWSFDHLLSHRTTLGRGKLRRRVAIRSVSGAVAPRYEPMLRTMGNELDSEGAYSILLDQVDEGTLVSYQYLDPFSNYRMVKRYVLVQTSHHPSKERDIQYPRLPLGDLLDHALARASEPTPTTWGHSRQRTIRPTM